MSIYNEKHLINIQDFHEETGIPLEMCRDLTVEFFEELQEKKMDIKKLLNEGEFSKVKEISHQMKGTASNLRIGHLRELFFKLEEASKGEALEDAEKVLEMLELFFE